MNKEYSCLLNINKFKGGGTEIYNRKLSFSAVERLCREVQNKQSKTQCVKLKTNETQAHAGTTHSNICTLLWGERRADYLKESEACIKQKSYNVKQCSELSSLWRL